MIDLETPQVGVWAVLRSIWRWVPLSACINVVVMCAALYENNFTLIAFFILTLWAAHNGWKYGLHITLFSYVGQRKMAQYDEVDFIELHEAFEQQALDRAARPCGPRWEEVRQFVILTNYKEDIEVLRLAIKSVATLRIATKQIGIVLAMEARQEGFEAKAQSLKLESAPSGSALSLTTRQASLVSLRARPLTPSGPPTRFWSPRCRGYAVTRPPRCSP